MSEMCRDLNVLKFLFGKVGRVFLVKKVCAARQHELSPMGGGLKSYQEYPGITPLQRECLADPAASVHSLGRPSSSQAA